MTRRRSYRHMEAVNEWEESRSLLCRGGRENRKIATEERDLGATGKIGRGKKGRGPGWRGRKGEIVPGTAPVAWSPLRDRLKSPQRSIKERAMGAEDGKGSKVSMVVVCGRGDGLSSVG